MIVPVYTRHTNILLYLLQTISHNNFVLTKYIIMMLLMMSIILSRNFGPGLRPPGSTRLAHATGFFNYIATHRQPPPASTIASRMRFQGCGQQEGGDGDHTVHRAPW